MSIKSFVRNESGAVTVDWVVLTAAIVGIAIAVLTLIAGGINTSANSTSSELDESQLVASLITGATPTLGPAGTVQEYLARNNGDKVAAYNDVLANAPEGFENFYYSVDSTNDAPLYFNDDSTLVSVNGQIKDASAYPGSEEEATNWYIVDWYNDVNAQQD